MNPIAFEPVARLQIVRDYLDAFPKATNAPLQLLRGRSKSSQRQRQSRPLRVGVVICGMGVATLCCETAGFPPEKSRALERLLEIFARHLSDCANRYLIANGSSDPPAVTRAKAHIRRHLTEPITIGDVARHVGLSEDYFARTFRRSTGLTLNEYLADERVECAKDLLSDPHTRIADIAFSAGFGSVPHFNRVFRKLTGTAPRAYRRSLRSNPNSDKKKSPHA